MCELKEKTGGVVEGYDGCNDNNITSGELTTWRMHNGTSLFVGKERAPLKVTVVVCASWTSAHSPSLR